MASDTSVATPHHTTNLLDPSVNKKMSLGVSAAALVTSPTNNTNHQSHVSSSSSALPNTSTQQRQSNQHDHSKGRDKEIVHLYKLMCVIVVRT